MEFLEFLGDIKTRKGEHLRDSKDSGTVDICEDFKHRYNFMTTKEKENGTSDK